MAISWLLTGKTCFYKDSAAGYFNSTLECPSHFVSPGLNKQDIIYKLESYTSRVILIFYLFLPFAFSRAKTNLTINLVQSDSRYPEGKKIRIPMCVVYSLCEISITVITLEWQEKNFSISSTEYLTDWSIICTDTIQFVGTSEIDDW